jgi:hypothetical protein
MSQDGGAKAYPTPPRASECRVLGHSVTRLEDLPLVTGQGRYRPFGPRACKTYFGRYLRRPGAARRNRSLDLGRHPRSAAD